MSTIGYIDDQNGNHVFPVTHERAVMDSDGVTLETKLGQKQDTIQDLSTIRSGAAAGATAVQPAALNAKQDTIDDLSAIRSGSALGETSVQPVDIEDMVEAEPIGSIIPPVNPSEFATTEEVSQLGQEVNDFSLPIISGKSVNLGRTIGATINLTPQNEVGWNCVVFPCVEGDSFIINGRGGNSTRLWGFVDAENKLIAVSTASLTGTNLKVFAPANSANFVSNGQGNLSVFCRKYGSLPNVNERLNDIATDVEDILPKVTVLQQEMGEFSNTTEVTLVTETPQRRWENVNGKVELGTNAASVTSMKPVSIVPFSPFSVTANESGTGAKAYFITDENDNILVTGWDGGTVKTETGIAPEGAAKIYINSVLSAGVPALLLGESIFKHLNILDGKVKDWVFILRGIVDNSTYRDLMTPQEGDLFYMTYDKKFYLCTGTSPLAYTTVTPRKDCIFVNGQNIYVWDGTALVSAFTEQVIYIKVFATSAPSGLSEGDYYYNTTYKQLRRLLTSQHYSTIVPLRYDTIYLYNQNIYLYNGTELFIPFVTSTDVSTMIDAAVETAVETAVEKYGARIIEDNTTPLELSEDDFVLGNLNGNTGEEISANNVVRSGFLAVVPGAGFSFQTSNSYRCDIFMYDADKAFVTHFGWKTGTYTGTLSERASYIRIVLASPSGTSTATVWEDAALSVTIGKKYVPTRAIGENDVNKVVKSYFDLELPILAPSPQLPANASEDSDFNAETVTSGQLYAALDDLISSIQSPHGRNGNYPKMLTKYDVSGLDASGVYPIYTYALTRRNRYAFRNADELYAWKDENDNLVFIDSCSPFVGQAIYFDSNRTASGKTIASYDSATGLMTSSDSVSYTRAEESNVAAKMFWTKISMQNSSAAGAIYGAFDENDNSLGNATFVDTTHLTFGGKTYTRAECFDYHTDRKATIFIWGNEHGPTSDPLEPSIILYRLAKDLVSGCRNNPFLMFLKQYCKIVFIPCANPWGCQYPRVYGRQNSAGVNINRNYDTPGWAVQESTEKGTYAGDQPETQYIMNMCKRFSPNISLDIHALGFGNPLADGLMYLSETAIPDAFFYLRTRETMFGLGFMFDQRGNPEPLQMAHGSEWMDYYRMTGGVFEMNAGPYSDDSHTYDGRQHTASVMEACYTELLNCIRMWLAKYDPTIDLSKMCIK